MKTNTIGERIAECRRNKGLTQFDLADGESDTYSCEEAKLLFNNIKDEKLRRVAIEQMRVLANM